MNQIQLKENSAWYPDAVKDTAEPLKWNPTPEDQIKKLRKAGMEFDYVSVSYVIDQLNKKFDRYWQFDFEVLAPDIILKSGWAAVKGTLTIRNPDGSQSSRSQVGSNQIQVSKDTGKILEPGDAIKGAVSDALKKCASLFGCAFDVYSGGQFE
jgi:hypothetical protein